MPDSVVLSRCRAVLPDTVAEATSVLVEQGIIAGVFPDGTRALPPGVHRVDTGGAIVGPGFIDPHCHGAADLSFFSEPEAVLAALVRQGTTGVLATMGYPDMAPGSVQPQLRELARRLEGMRDRRVVLGVHLEGPYTNPKYGARLKGSVLRGFDPFEYNDLLANPLVRWWTCAPELPGARVFIESAARRGVVVAAGHTEATAEETLAAIACGLKAITHWTNATGNVQPPRFRGTRNPGIDEVALVHDELAVEIIPDQEGCHVHPLMARLLYRAKGPDRILIITDASYRRASDPPLSPEKFTDVRIDGAGDLAGSRLTMAGAARNFQRFTGCPLPALFRMAALNAARLLGVDGSVGSIEVGKRANLVVLDDAFAIRATFLDGRGVFVARDELRHA